MVQIYFSACFKQLNLFVNTCRVCIHGILVDIDSLYINIARLFVLWFADNMH